MALHRKQRGIGDGPPQFVRIPASRASSRAMSYLLHETHEHAQRINAKRYAADDRSRKISSLQLRACFLLCVLLYFGAIYFADDIASIGRAVGSEQNSQSFFMHSLRPRGNVRVGKAIDAKKVEETKAPSIKKEGEDKQQHQQQHIKLDVPSKELPQSEKHLLEAEVATAEIEKARATELPQEPDAEKIILQRDSTNERKYASVNAAPLDDQNVGILAQIEDAKTIDPGEKIYVARKPNVKSTSPVETNDGKNGLRHPSKVRDVDAVSTASPARIKNQHIRGNVENKPKHTANQIRKPNEGIRLHHGQHHEELKSTKMTQSALTPQAKTIVVKHVLIIN